MENVVFQQLAAVRVSLFRSCDAGVCMELAQKVGRKGVIPTGFVDLVPCQERTVGYDTVVCWHQAGVVSNGAIHVHPHLLVSVNI